MDNRGMNFTRMVDLVSENGPIQKFRREVESYFEGLKKSLDSKVDQVYEGRAATLFKEKLTATSTKLTQLLDEILAECVNKTNVKSEEYNEQELKMQNSLEQQ